MQKASKKENVQTIVTRRYLKENAVIAWTDGACEPNPGAGGWGVVIEDGTRRLVDQGGEPNTTNNRMELAAIIQAIKMTKKDRPLIVRTDSQLSLLCAVGRWKRKANLDMWKTFDALTEDREIYFEWWRGHSGTPGNELADELANDGRLEAMDERENMVFDVGPSEATGRQHAIEAIVSYERNGDRGIVVAAAVKALIDDMKDSPLNEFEAELGAFIDETFRVLGESAP